MRSLVFLVLSLSIAACSPYSPDLGDSPFICGPPEQNPRCPDDYTCQMASNGMEYCLKAGGTVPVDGNNLNCADDSMLEPNEDTMHAWQTPVATQKTMFTLAGLAICPAGDKDNYAIQITQANQNLEVLIEYDAAMGADLQGSILNSGGTPIANASPTDPGHRRAYTPNLPIGVYFASVYGPMMGDLKTNNYKMSINVTGP